MQIACKLSSNTYSGLEMELEVQIAVYLKTSNLDDEEGEGGQEENGFTFQELFRILEETIDIKRDFTLIMLHFIRFCLYCSLERERSLPSSVPYSSAYQSDIV